jgi:hypothetical protein
VTWEVPPLAEFSYAFEYKLMVKLQAGQALSREEKDRLFSETQSGSRKGHSRLHGWDFDYIPYMRRIWVKLKNYGLLEVFAPDKMAVRAYFGGDVVEMVYVDDGM